VGCVCRWSGASRRTPWILRILAINRGLMTQSQCLLSKAQLPKAARVCRAKPGNVVTRVLSTASVRRSGRFPALPYPPGGRLNLLQSSGVDRLPAIGSEVETRLRRSPQAVPSGMPTRRSPYPAKSECGVPTVREPKLRRPLYHASTPSLPGHRAPQLGGEELRSWAFLVCHELHLRAFQRGTR
jgi:hypothetical protein